MHHDPAFLWSLGISVACHLLVIITQTLALPRTSLPPIRQKTMEVVYEHPASDRLAEVQDALEDLKTRSAAPPALTVSSHHIHVGTGQGGALLGGIPWVGEGEPGMALGASGSGASALWTGSPLVQASVVDLSNLAEASRGDPVLLSYFSAIRERIQRTANEQTWMSSEASEGMVYVSFLLTRSGQVASPQALVERSASSPQLHAIAVKIIAASSPFPPLPPSLEGAAKTIVVPLEFLRGS
jgi:TonB family protein